MINPINFEDPKTREQVGICAVDATLKYCKLSAGVDVDLFDFISSHNATEKKI